MDPSTEMQGSNETPGDAGTQFLRRIFTGPKGLRAGWRLLIFLALFGILLYGLLIPAMMLRLTEAGAGAGATGVLTVGETFAGELISALALVLAAGIMTRIEKRSFADYGLPFRGDFMKRFAEGFAWGLAACTASILMIYALHGFSFGGLALSRSGILKYGAAWAIVFLVLGLFEEFWFRGYMQAALGDGMGFWPAAILLSLAFGYIHIGNPGEGWGGALQAGLFGLLCAFSLRRTGTIWLGLGLHAAWDWAQTFLYSVPDSGLLAEGHLLNSSLHGPRWLTGGSVGPEGSVIDLIVLVMLFVVFSRFYPARGQGQDGP